MKLVRRSALQSAGSGDPGPAHLGGAPGERVVLLLDSIGELAAIYQLADAVFVGGSLEHSGGHNPLEPAAFAKVPVFGASMENFREIARTLLNAGAAVQVNSGAELAGAWITLLGDDERRRNMGFAAREIVKRNRGATAAALERLALLLEPANTPAETPAKAPQ
jgi:3-deoxy-D-manno-octulosonic-acid transferase